MTATPAAPKLRSVHRQMRFATPRVIAALTVREMTTIYGRRPGGYIWTIVEPVAGIALFTWVFTSMGVRHPGLGTNFQIFYATGLLPYTLSLALMSKLMSAVSYSKAILAYPRVTLVDVLVARILVHLMTQIIVAYLVIGGIRYFWDTGTQLLFGPILLGFAMATALGIGLGLMNCYLAMRFDYWGMIWNVLTRPLVLISGVMMVPDALPPEWLRRLLWNPFVHVITETRKGFYHGYTPSYVDPVYVFGLSLALGVVGFLFLWRTYRDLMER